MADINIRAPGCEDDCEGERGERGERGKRGHRGHRGHDGHNGHDGRDGDTGSTGPTGPTGPSEGALIGRQVFNVAGGGTYTPTPGTTRAIVRGAGGGGGGGSVGSTGANNAAGASGGNSGIAIEAEVVAPPATFLTGGPFVVGVGGLGGIAGSNGSSGSGSTLLIGGVPLTAPPGGGGIGSLVGGFIPPVIIGPNGSLLAVGVDYQSADLGGAGFAITTSSAGLLGGHGGSGSYGIGGRTSTIGNLPGPGGDASGNGAGGSGAASNANGAGFNGGDGTPGIWIIEEYS